MLIRLVAGAMLVSLLQGRARPAEAQWTGTITIEERASGTVRGDTTSLGFTGRETVTYTLNGDGTASWQGSFRSNWDMSGLYTIPATGTGSGFGYAGASFDGQVWEVSAGADDTMPTRADHTAEDKAWETKSIVALLREVAKASGQPAPSAGKRIEKGERGVNGAAIPVRAAANATTLSGSVSETVPSGADRLGGPGTIPSTITYTWNLTKGPAQSQVKIYGNECGCIEVEATEKTMHFIAGASPAGGEFSEFVVTSDGKMPEIVSNNGGERPSLDITGTRDTGTVTLKIRYTRDGVRRESAPFIVEFCEIAKITLMDGETDLAFNIAGRLVVDAQTKAWRAGKNVSAELEWDIDKIGSPTSLAADPSDKKGEHIRFTFQDLPKNNSEFGEKQLRVKATGGKCTCDRDETVRAFYIDSDIGHPDDATSPNWFYYWKQTSAVPGTSRSMVEYRSSLVDPNLRGVSIARYDGATEKILISGLLLEASACKDEVTRERVRTSREHAVGIDCFGETIKHELQHRADAIAWWGSPKGAEGASPAEALLRDADGDHLPIDEELRLPGCLPINSYSCKQRPFEEASDAEINAYYEGWLWPLHSADSEDWSCGPLSKLWSGKKCG